MTDRNSGDPRRAYWLGVGGQLDDPTVRAQRGTVRRHRLFYRLRARISRFLRG